MISSNQQLDLDFSRCQRWRNGRESYRPARECFDARHASVERIDTASAKAFVCEHHYAASFPASRFNAGLFVRRPFQSEELVGVATFSVPMSQACIPHYFPHLSAAEGVELGRLILLDEIAANAESWFVARCFRLLKASLSDVSGVLSYADPMPRYSKDGELVKKGHVGTVYRATNGLYRGRSRARTLLLCPDGSVANERALSKLRGGESGSDYVERQLRGMGASARACSESGRDYLDRLIASDFFRRQSHPGNYAFTWELKS